MLGRSSRMSLKPNNRIFNRSVCIVIHKTIHRLCAAESYKLKFLLYKIQYVLILQKRSCIPYRFILILYYKMLLK